MGKEDIGNIFGRDSKAGAGPMSADMGARQGRAAIVATATMERLTESLFPSQNRAQQILLGNSKQTTLLA